MAGKKKVEDENVEVFGEPLPPPTEPQNLVPAEVPHAAPPPVVATKPVGLATKAAAEPEVVERVKEAVEALETFNGIKLPLVRFKDGFKMSEDAEDVESFEGVIIHTKESNVYYKGRFKAGEVSKPDCFSPDGRKPTQWSGDKPVHHECATCPMNQYGSAAQGDGKACKNTRPLFVLVKNPESGELGVIPKVLRVPPTSLSLVKGFVVNVAADYGSYYGVLTKFTVFQKNQNQTHNNIKFSVAGRLSSQDKANVAHIREGWMPLMKEGNFGVDEPETASAPQQPAAGDDTARF
jgi:hypothetical protein